MPSELLRQHPDELTALTGLAAEHLGIDPAFVEKDFWVTEVLRAVTIEHTVADLDGVEHVVDVVFKGGTSLSRVYGITERFSEDVDVLLSFPVRSSPGARHRVITAKCEAARTHLGLAAQSAHSFNSTTGVKRSVRYTYPAQAHSGEITTGVLLELGSRGGTVPVRQHELRSMLATHALEQLHDSPDEWAEYEPVKVIALAPERTLLEKLSHLHSAGRMATEGDDAQLSRGGRHIYDVYRLLTNDSTVAALNAMGEDGVMALCTDIDQWSEAGDWVVDPRPGGGYASGVLYQGDPTVAAIAASAYQRATGLIWGDVPTLDQCLSKVSEFRGLL